MATEMPKLYTLVCLNPEEYDHPVVCYDRAPEGLDPDPICTPDVGYVFARQGELSRNYPNCEYVVCELVPVML